jgi:hypothetical protein
LNLIQKVRVATALDGQRVRGGHERVVVGGLSSVDNGRRTRVDYVRSADVHVVIGGSADLALATIATGNEKAAAQRICTAALDIRQETRRKLVGAAS